MFYKGLFGVLLLVLFISQTVSAAGPVGVNLGSSGSFVILAKSGISTTGTTSIVGDMGVSPIDSTAITGFGLSMNSSNQFSTSPLVNGKAYATNYAPPTPTTMTTAISDMEIAYTDAAGRTNPTATELGAGNIGGMTLAPGLYKWSTGVTIPTSLALSGAAGDVWIFQIAQNLDVGNGVTVVLNSGAQAKNVFWQVAGQATLGTTSDVKGIILSQTAVVMKTGAKLNGRALAQTAVTLDASTVIAPTNLRVQSFRRLRMLNQQAQQTVVHERRRIMNQQEQQDLLNVRRLRLLNQQEELRALHECRIRLANQQNDVRTLEECRRLLNQEGRSIIQQPAERREEISIRN